LYFKHAYLKNLHQLNTIIDNAKLNTAKEDNKRIILMHIKTNILEHLLFVAETDLIIMLIQCHFSIIIKEIRTIKQFLQGVQFTQHFRIFSAKVNL